MTVTWSTKMLGPLTGLSQGVMMKIMEMKTVVPITFPRNPMYRDLDVRLLLGP